MRSIIDFPVSEVWADCLGLRVFQYKKEGEKGCGHEKRLCNRKYLT